MRQANVRAQVAAQAEQYRSPSDKARLDRIVKERRFGDYDILDELGRGGMGVVYKAFHGTLKRIVALKIVLPDADDNVTMLKRFKREAELHARRGHPNIVHVHDSGVIDGIHYFAMDFVTGTQLTKLMGAPEFTLRKRVQVARQVADALHHAHEHGVVHRDIKPDNIIVDAGWTAHLVDFGIAKPTDMSGMENITRQGLAVGTPHYMAPEQFRPKLGEVGPRSDVYSLGAVLFHALTGHPPFEADTAHQVLIKAATQDAPPLVGEQTPSDEEIPQDLAAIISKSLIKEPENRYQSARALAEDLSKFLAGKEVSALPLSESEKLKRKLAKNRQSVKMFAMAALLLFVTLASFTVTLLASISQNGDITEAVAEARREVIRARQVADSEEDVEERLADVRTALDEADDEVQSGGSIVLITMITAGVLSLGLILGFAIVVLVVPLLRQRDVDARGITAPSEIGATADEVS